MVTSAQTTKKQSSIRSSGSTKVNSGKILKPKAKRIQQLSDQSNKNVSSHSSAEKSTDALNRPPPNSDISEDEADNPHPGHLQRKSLVHQHAQKLSANEYRCNHCSKVSQFEPSTN